MDKRPTLKLQASGKEVRELKSALCILDYLRNGNVNDQFDVHCKAALECFQEDEGLSVDGICGPETWKALNERIGMLG